jgi:hypothetical protein
MAAYERTFEVGELKSDAQIIKWLSNAIGAIRSKARSEKIEMARGLAAVTEKLEDSSEVNFLRDMIMVFRFFMVDLRDQLMEKKARGMQAEQVARAYRGIIERELSTLMSELSSLERLESAE